MPAQLFDEAFRGPFPNVTRWFQTCAHQPEFAKVMGEAALAKETLKHSAAPAKAHAAPKEAAAPKPAAPKQPARKAESKPAPEKARRFPLCFRSKGLLVSAVSLHCCAPRGCYARPPTCMAAPGLPPGHAQPWSAQCKVPGSP